MMSPPVTPGVHEDDDSPMKWGNLEKMKNKNFLGIEVQQAAVCVFVTVLSTPRWALASAHVALGPQVWSSRWVVLRRSGLEYFATNRPGEAVRGRIATRDLKGVDVNTKKRPWGFTVSRVNNCCQPFTRHSAVSCDSDCRSALAGLPNCPQANSNSAFASPG